MQSLTKRLTDLVDAKVPLGAIRKPRAKAQEGETLLSWTSGLPSAGDCSLAS